ncbi:pilus assembly protein PilM [Candidatus Sumerlaeota bacterium]|nr:pilus assembly protein PilM [Candidatus Sumerlaeota bacterium]
MARYTVLELTENEARLLQVGKSRKSEAAVEQAFVVDFSDLEKDEEGMAARGKRLQEKIKERKIAPGEAGIIIPKNNSILRTAQLPSADAEELRSMAMFEAEKFIPFNVERHIISNGILRQDDVQGSHVLITAVDRPIMDAALALAAAAQLEPVVAEVSSIALVRAFSHSPAGQEHHSGSVLLLNVGRTQTDISILVDGMLLNSRAQNVGYQKLATDLKEARGDAQALTLAGLRSVNMMAPDDAQAAPEEREGGGNKTGDVVRGWIQRIVRFTRQTFEFAAREQGIPASSRIYLCGEGNLLQGFAQALAINLKVEVLPFDSLTGVARAPGATLDEESLSAMSNAWGTAIRLIEEAELQELPRDRVNLLPPEMILQHASAEKKMLLAISGFMVVITMLLLFITYSTRASAVEELTKRYTEYNKKMRSYVESLDEKEKQLDIIRNITTDRASPMFILNEITKFDGVGSVETGGTLTIEEFKYGTTKDVTISGYAVASEDIVRFSDYLEKLTIDGKEVFSTVGLPQPTGEDLPGRKTVWKFTLNAVLNELNARDAESSASDDGGDS